MLVTAARPGFLSTFGSSMTPVYSIVVAIASYSQFKEKWLLTSELEQRDSCTHECRSVGLDFLSPCETKYSVGTPQLRVVCLRLQLARFGQARTDSLLLGIAPASILVIHE